MNMTAEKIISIAILKAKPGKREALREGLLKLIEPTRQEAGNLDYVLFELKNETGTFYMREAFTNQDALDDHFKAPYFQAFAATIEDLLEEPLRLIFLDQVSS
ncbi:putative quinol monooxygenase [Rhizobium rhizogenes]|uniref:putative quinol monooxygenase n=1 Tax=Rhizobium rhizogenes TaxID=359 RepID=UPI0022CAB3F1|nr:putative quinol monooxygenase [Rhizobium rhizogenes]MCZ7482884.1 putative quinol monooxygenase [Rhizobium rhizogenes]